MFPENLAKFLRKPFLQNTTLLNKKFLYHSCFQQPVEWEENVRCLLKNFVNVFLQNQKKNEAWWHTVAGLKLAIHALLRSCFLCMRGNRKSNNEYEKLNKISFKCYSNSEKKWQLKKFLELNIISHTVNFNFHSFSLFHWAISIKNIITVWCHTFIHQQ